MRLFSSRNFHTDNSTPLLHLSKLDRWGLEHAVQGTHIFGATGSGKTSGSGAAIAEAFLRAGMGGLVLCVRDDEAGNWMRLAKRTGRSNSIVHFSPESDHGFNFMEYQLRYEAMQRGGSVNPLNAIDLILKIAEAMKRGGNRDVSDDFWDNATRVLLTNAIEPIYAAYGMVSLPMVRDMVISAPADPAQYNDPALYQTSFNAKTLKAAWDHPLHELGDHTKQAVMGYWQRSYGTLTERTKSNIVITLENLVSPFLRDDFHHLFSSETTIVPELSREGAVILVDFPVLSMGVRGQIIQTIFKFLWQRTIGGQVETGGKKLRPCFLWIDEAQFFLNDDDYKFQSNARAARACGVYMSQNLDAYYAAAGGGEAGRQAASALLENLQTHIFHANNSRSTNEFASRMIGEGVVRRHGLNVSDSDNINAGGSDSYQTMPHSGTPLINDKSENYGNTWGTGQGISDGITVTETDRPLLEPGAMVGLRTGGTANGKLVDGIIVRSGAPFKQSGQNFLPVTFRQH